MREARSYIGGPFMPASANEFFEIVSAGGKHTAFVLQVYGYWDMVAAFVQHGALDATLVYNTCQEMYFQYAKIQPYLARVSQADESARVADQCGAPDRGLKGRPQATRHHAKEPRSNGAGVANQEAANIAALRRCLTHPTTTRPALANGAPHAFEIGWLDKKHVSRQDVPFEHRKVQRIFKAQVEEKPQQQQWIAESPEPDQNSHAQLKGKRKPATHPQNRGILDPTRYRKSCDRWKMDYVIERGPMRPRISLHLPPKRAEIQQRQLKLDHSLRPWSSWPNDSALQPPANAYQPI